MGTAFILDEVIETVEGLLFEIPSKTINWATYSPSLSGVKVGETIVVSDSELEEPLGLTPRQL